MGFLEYQNEGANFYYWDRKDPGIYRGKNYHIRNTKNTSERDIADTISKIKELEKIDKNEISIRSVREIYKTHENLIIFKLCMNDCDI